MSSLRFIYKQRMPAWREVNGIADTELDWDMLGDDAADYLRNVTIGGDA